MKVIAINGSPRANGNTFHSLETCANSLREEGIEVDIVHIGGSLIRGCVSCRSCAKNRDEECAIKGDPVNETIQKIKDADGIILGSPVYYSGVAGTMKSFCDRLFFVAQANGGLFRSKAGAAVVSVRRAGGMTAFDELNHYFLISEMVVPGSAYWNVAYGSAEGEALRDEEGMDVMSILGKNMAWLLKLMDHGRNELPPPERQPKRMMNFIR